MKRVDVPHEERERERELYTRRRLYRLFVIMVEQREKVYNNSCVRFSMLGTGKGLVDCRYPPPPPPQGTASKGTPNDVLIYTCMYVRVYLQTPVCVS